MEILKSLKKPHVLLAALVVVGGTYWLYSKYKKDTDDAMASAASNKTSMSFTGNEMVYANADGNHGSNNDCVKTIPCPCSDVNAVHKTPPPPLPTNGNIPVGGGGSVPKCYKTGTGCVSPR